MARQIVADQVGLFVWLPEWSLSGQLRVAAVDPTDHYTEFLRLDRRGTEGAS
jgi:hypothetical protein